MKRASKAGGTGKRTDARTELDKGGASARTVVSIDILRELASATTAYHEAPPDLADEARLAYEEVLGRFRLSQPQAGVRTMSAGAGMRRDSAE